MVTINIFPPPGTTEKQAESNTGITSSPEPGKSIAGEAAFSDLDLPAPTLQNALSPTGINDAPSPSLRQESFQEQEASSSLAPVPSLDFLNAAASAQAVPNLEFNPGDQQKTADSTPSPSLLPPEESNEHGEKSFTKKK